MQREREKEQRKRNAGSEREQAERGGGKRAGTPKKNKGGFFVSFFPMQNQNNRQFSIISREFDGRRERERRGDERRRRTKRF